MIILEFFKSTEHLSHLGFIFRTVASILLIYLMSRFLKKRAAGQFTSFDFAFLWMLGALSVAPLLDGKVTFSQTIIPTATLYFLHFLLSFIRIKSKAFSFLIAGKPIVLVEKGKIKEKNMRRSFFNNELLLSELRLINNYDLEELEEVRLETNGHLSVVKKSKYTTPSQSDFHILISPAFIPTVLVNNGKLLYKNLKSLNLTKEWMINELHKYGVSDIKKIYLVTINSSGKLYYSLKQN